MGKYSQDFIYRDFGKSPHLQSDIIKWDLQFGAHNHDYVKLNALINAFIIHTPSPRRMLTHSVLILSYWLAQCPIHNYLE